MNEEQIIAATEAVSWLAEQAGVLGEFQQERNQMSLTLHLANLYLLEYAGHLRNGADPYDALISTVRGDLSLSDSQRALVLALMPPNNPSVNDPSNKE